MSTEAKIPLIRQMESKNTSKRASTIMKQALSCRFRNGSTFIIYQLDKMKGKYSTIYPLDTGRPLTRSIISSWKKPMDKDRKKNTYLNIMKAIYRNLIVIIISNGKKIIVFLLKQGRRQSFLTSPYLFNIVFDFLSRAIRMLKYIKGIQLGRKDIIAWKYKMSWG